MSDQTIGLPKQAISAERTSADFSQTPTALKNLSDEGLMERLAERDPHALSMLFDRYHRRVLKVCLRIVRDRGEAEDLLQEIFYQIYCVADKFDSTKGSAGAWILHCAYNRSLNRRRYLELRKMYDHEQISQLDDLDSYYAPNGLTEGELAYLVQQGLRTLSPEQRATLELVCFQGLSLAEIAHRTKKSVMSVRHYYYRGLRKLKEVLDYSPTS